MAILDGFLCYVIFKITLSKEAQVRLLVDKMTGQVYYIKSKIKVGKSTTNTTHESDQLETLQDDVENAPEYLMSMTEELPSNLYDPGWNRRIIEQFLMETERPTLASEIEERQRLSTLVVHNSLMESNKSLMERYDASQ